MAVLCVFYSLGDGELALCRQPVLILWPPPKLQHVGNKPFSSNPQTVQQSIGNYLSQSMGWPFYFSLSPALQLSYLYPFSSQPSLTLLLLMPSVSFFCCLSVFCTYSFTHPSPTFTCIPSSPLRAAAPTLNCDSSAAPEPLTDVAFTHGIYNTAGLTSLGYIMNLTCSYNQRALPLTVVTTRVTYCTPC